MHAALHILLLIDRVELMQSSVGSSRVSLCFDPLSRVETSDVLYDDFRMDASRLVAYVVHIAPLSQAAFPSTSPDAGAKASETSEQLATAHSLRVDASTLQCELSFEFH